MEQPNDWAHDIANWIVGGIGIVLAGVAKFMHGEWRKVKEAQGAFVTIKDFDEYKTSREKRDQDVDRKLDRIDETTTRTHERIDDLYRDMSSRRER